MSGCSSESHARNRSRGCHPATVFRDREILTRAELLEAGCTVGRIASAVGDGTLMRVRRGYYCRPALDVDTQQAVRVGGRLSCVSELRRRGVWTVEPAQVHLQIAPNAARLRDPQDRMARLRDPRGCCIHWQSLRDPAGADRGRVGIVDAMATALSCLPEREALAAWDSALHLKLLTAAQVRLIVGSLSGELRSLIRRADPASESGIETVVRDIAVQLGFRVRTQHSVRNVGRGDVLIEECVLVEADGGAYHGAGVTSRDRRRDAGFVRSGLTTLHFRYSQVIFEPREVAETIIAAVAVHRGVRNSGRIVARARKRLEKLFPPELRQGGGVEVRSAGSSSSVRITGTPDAAASARLESVAVPCRSSQTPSRPADAAPMASVCSRSPT